jgi:hypothetical protein
MLVLKREVPDMSVIIESEEELPPSHFPDLMRIGVLVGEEGDELRLQAHFMQCESCREPALRLARQLSREPKSPTPSIQISCAQARNALFRYFEQGREPVQAELDHLNACADCCEHFLGPARCARHYEAEDDTPSLG